MPTPHHDRDTGGADAAPSTKAALIQAARRILETQGFPALTLRAVAKEVGVSHMAPYRHFPHGYTELLAAAAIEGFGEMIAFLDARPVAAEPRRRIFEVALRYVQFGVERPHLYRALFSAQLAEPLESFAEWLADGTIGPASHDTYRRLHETKLEAFAAIVGPLAEAQRAGVLRAGNPGEFGLALAALVHGLVGEFIDEGLGGRLSRQAPWSRVRRGMSHRIVELMLTGMEA